MFDPFFLPMLVVGPISLAYLVRNELRRAEEGFRPDGLSILLGIFAALGLREWLLLVAQMAFDTKLQRVPPTDIQAYGLWIAVTLVIASYLTVAWLRTKRLRKR